ncbi:MAG: helix-turn-helix transcriptional regulator [Pseudonocardiaceae bacterium]
MTTAEFAELAHTSPETIRYWRHIGRGPASFKLGRRVLYDRSEVLAWIRDTRNAARTA